MNITDNSRQDAAYQAWEGIFRREGRVFLEPFAGIGDLTRAFSGHACHRLLDLGCGSGRHLVYLARAGFQLCGLDISPAALRLTSQWLADEALSASLVLGDVRCRLPFRDQAFDGLLSTQVIHHATLATVRVTIGEIRRVLRPGGLAFVSVPCRPHENDDWVEVEPNTFVPTTGTELGLPHHIFTPQALQAEFSAFKIIDLAIRGEVVMTLLAEKME